MDQVYYILCLKTLTYNIGLILHENMRIYCQRNTSKII